MIGYHVELRFLFVVQVIENLMDFQNLIRRKFGKNILNFDKLVNIFFQDLSI